MPNVKSSFGEAHAGRSVFEINVAHCELCYVILSMIKSFKHKVLRKFFETGSVSGIEPGHKQKLRMRLIAHDTATSIEDMNTPCWRLHSLKGDRQGLWAIDVNRNWRIVFEFKDGNAYIVDYEDYHSFEFFALCKLIEAASLFKHLPFTMSRSLLRAFGYYGRC